MRTISSVPSVSSARIYWISISKPSNHASSASSLCVMRAMSSGKMTNKNSAPFADKTPLFLSLLTRERQSAIPNLTVSAGIPSRLKSYPSTLTRVSTLSALSARISFPLHAEATFRHSPPITTR